MLQHDIRVIVRGAYDLQELRIQMGNRIVANFKAKLGQAPSESESELDEDAKQILKDIRSSYKKITDGVKNFPKHKNFVGDEIISSFTELCLVGQYIDLETDEYRHFKRMEHVLEDVPIYAEYLKHIRGIGPAMAGVIVSEIDISKARYPSSLWKYCFPAGTLISTPNGCVEIDKLSTGDSVIDGDGKETKVINPMNRKFTGNMVTISCIGSIPITMTDEHPLLVIDKDGIESWKSACDIKQGEYISIPNLKFFSEDGINWNAPKKAIEKNSLLGGSIPITLDSCYLIGRFVGDGSASTWIEGDYIRGICQLSFSKDEVNELKLCRNIARNIFGASHISELATTTNNLVFGRLTVARKFKEWFGYLAQNKKLPEFILGLEDKELIKSFLRGYFDTDGHIVKNGKSAGTILASSASITLILQIQLLLTKIGVFGSIHKQNRNDLFGEINGRRFNQINERYIISIPKSKSSVIYSNLNPVFNRSAAKIKQSKNGERWLLSVKSVKKFFVSDLDVFNIHTESNTYLAQNITVHNCGIDTAEDGKGRSRRPEHLVKVKYRNKDGVESERNSITFNPFLKTKLIGVLANSFIKLANPIYAPIYRNYKHRLENHPAHADKTKAHRNNMAKRYMIKIFLTHLYNKWRILEGLEVAPPYHEAKLGIVHSKSD